ncbi:hypothetical protein ACCO45_005515 [Purpureocillium lilacinum]|uniref:Uncharacterized protein n=1 Tax=Purpureocillium lilacinum TaxID=33203 RepID=A0ACC4DYQ0_PURLI
MRRSSNEMDTLTISLPVETAVARDTIGRGRSADATRRATMTSQDAATYTLEPPTWNFGDMEGELPQKGKLRLQSGNRQKPSTAESASVQPPLAVRPEQSTIPAQQHHQAATSAMERAAFVIGELKKAVEEDYEIRDEGRFIGYDPRMVGTSLETATPSIIVKCKKTILKRLRDRFKDRAADRLYCQVDSIRFRLFKGCETPFPPFKLVFIAASPLERWAADEDLAVFLSSDETLCGALLQCEGRIATAGLMLELEGEWTHFSRLITCGIVNEPKSLTSRVSLARWTAPLRTPRAGENLRWTRPRYSHPETCTGETPLLELPIIAPPPNTQPENRGTTENAPVKGWRLNGHVALRPSSPYLDWGLMHLDPDIMKSRRGNMIYPKGKSAPPVELRDIAHVPRSHATPVYMVSGVRGTRAGRLLDGFSFLGSSPGQDICKAPSLSRPDRVRKDKRGSERAQSAVRRQRLGHFATARGQGAFTGQCREADAPRVAVWPFVLSIISSHPQADLSDAAPDQNQTTMNDLVHVKTELARAKIERDRYEHLYKQATLELSQTQAAYENISAEASKHRDDAYKARGRTLKLEDGMERLKYETEAWPAHYAVLEKRFSDLASQYNILKATGRMTSSPLSLDLPELPISLQASPRYRESKRLATIMSTPGESSEAKAPSLQSKVSFASKPRPGDAPVSSMMYDDCRLNLHDDDDFDGAMTTKFYL